MRNSLLLLLSMLCASSALAEPPALPPTKIQESASALVQKQLLTPLMRVQAKLERYSRAARAPAQRRVRVLDTVGHADIRGKTFVRFAVDVRYGRSKGDSWKEAAILGCAYLGESQVFVQRGDHYLPAASMLGNRSKPQPDVCRAALGEPMPLASAGR